MSNTKLRLSAVILGVIITTALVASSTYAFGHGWGRQGNNLKTAIENNDYSTLGDNPKITEEQFNQMIEVHNLMQVGDYEVAKEMRKELGLNKKGFGVRRGMSNKAHKMFDLERREAVLAALEAGDYSAWLEVVGEDCPLTDKITEDNFFKLVEAHNLMQEAREIMEELGITKGMGMGWIKY